MWGKAIAALFDLFDQIGRYLSNQQLIDAGKAEQQVKAQAQVEEHAQQAAKAVEVVQNPAIDPDYAKRVRNKYDDDAAG